MRCITCVCAPVMIMMMMTMMVGQLKSVAVHCGEPFAGPFGKANKNKNDPRLNQQNDEIPMFKPQQVPIFVLTHRSIFTHPWRRRRVHEFGGQVRNTKLFQKHQTREVALPDPSSGVSTSVVSSWTCPATFSILDRVTVRTLPAMAPAYVARDGRSARTEGAAGLPVGRSKAKSSL